MKRFSEISLVIILSFLAILMPKVLFSQLHSSGLSWQQTNSELDYPIYQFVSHDDNLFAALYGAGVFKTADEGENWIPCHNGLSNFLARDLVVSGDNLFVGTNKGGVFKSSNNGESWQAVNDAVLHKNIWSLLATESRLFAGTAKGIFFTDDEGSTWQKANLPRPEAHHQMIFSFGVNGRSILAGSNSHVYLSEDMGETWEQIKVPTGLDVMTIKVQNGSWLLGTSGEGILSSVDGRNWKVWNQEAGNTRSLILVENNLVLGLAVGGVVDVAADQSQTNLNEGFTDPSIKSLGYHDGKLYAGTYKKGIWRYDIPKTDFTPLPTNNRKVRKTVNVFPNPTTDGIITITYELETTANTYIELFDAFGKSIAQISPLSEQYKGFHQVSYDMNGLTGGTYYFHLQLGDRKVTKPIVLIKQ